MAILWKAAFAVTRPFPAAFCSAKSFVILQSLKQRGFYRILLQERFFGEQNFFVHRHLPLNLPLSSHIIQANYSHSTADAIIKLFDDNRPIAFYKRQWTLLRQPITNLVPLHQFGNLFSRHSHHEIAGESVTLNTDEFTRLKFQIITIRKIGCSQVIFYCVHGRNLPFKTCLKLTDVSIKCWNTFKEVFPLK